MESLSTQSFLKLLQITSPSLPVGAFSYSQGLEWAVEAKWISNKPLFVCWLQEQLNGALAQQELPLLLRLINANKIIDYKALQDWDRTVIAYRETSELRQEEQKRGGALNKLLASLDVPALPIETRSHLAAFARFCIFENIALPHALHGYAYSWLDNQVTAAIKLVPLGQSEGQAILYTLGEDIEAAVLHSQSVADDELGYSSPAIAQASSFHETQYCRLFRS